MYKMKIDWDTYVLEHDQEESGWEGDGEGFRDYHRELDDIPIEEIERYLRKKKLDRIKKEK